MSDDREPAEQEDEHVDSEVDADSSGTDTDTRAECSPASAATHHLPHCRQPGIAYLPGNGADVVPLHYWLISSTHARDVAKLHERISKGNGRRFAETRKSSLG